MGRIWDMMYLKSHIKITLKSHIKSTLKSHIKNTLKSHILYITQIIH